MKLRTQKAQLLGFSTSADFILDDTMAKTPKAVYDLLNTVWTPAVAKAKEEAGELQKLMDAEGKSEKLEPWDWWYYSEKLRNAPQSAIRHEPCCNNGIYSVAISSMG